MQFGGTLADVVTSAAVLWVLLPQTDLGFPAFVAIYAGWRLASASPASVPAGLGVFEAVIVGVIGRTAPIDRVLSALFLYRVIYYGVPLVVASGVVSALELRRAAAGAQASRGIARRRRLSPRVPRH